MIDHLDPNSPRGNMNQKSRTEGPADFTWESACVKPKPHFPLFKHLFSLRKAGRPVFLEVEVIV